MTPRLTDEQLADVRCAVVHFKWLDDHGVLTHEEGPHVAALSTHVPALLAELDALRHKHTSLRSRLERTAVDALTVDGEAFALSGRVEEARALLKRWVNKGDLFGWDDDRQAARALLERWSREEAKR